MPQLVAVWSLPRLALIAVVLLSAGLNLFRLNEEGYDNVYYAASSGACSQAGIISSSLRSTQPDF